METSNVNWSLWVAPDAANIHLEEEAEGVPRRPGSPTHRCVPHLHGRVRPQVLRADVLQLQLVGEGQNLEVCGRQAGVVPGPLGELRH